MDQELSNNNIAKRNGILRYFIGFAQMNDLNKVEESSEEDCLTVLDWLSSNNIDLNKEYWFKTEDGDLIPQLEVDMTENDFLSWICELKSMLPILLKCNGNVQFVNETGKTILHVFIEDYLTDYSTINEFDRQSFEIHQVLEYLIDIGIPVEAADENGNTPLHIAARLKKLDLVQIMFQHYPNYPNINARNNEGNTVLHILCCTEDCLRETVPLEQCVQSVLSKGADVNIQNSMGWAPVHFAASCNYLDVLKVVLEGGADLNLLTNSEENALLVSLKYSRNPFNKSSALVAVSGFKLTEFVELLINKGCNVNARNRDGYSLLHYTCMHHEVSISKILIESGADIHCRTKDFLVTPLHSAACRSSVLSLSSLLVEAGAEVNVKTVDGVTPLHLASLSGQLDTVIYLMQKGADVSCRENIFGFTPLHMAVLGGDKTTLKYFLRRQESDVNDGGNYGITALHLAAFRGNFQCIKMILEHGADVHRRDNLVNSTVLHFAAQQGKILDSVSPMLKVKHKPCWENDLVFYRSRGTVALLVENGVDVNATDVYGRKPLHLATMYAERKKYRTPNVSIVTGRQDVHSILEDVSSIIGLLNSGAHVEGNAPLLNVLKAGFSNALKVLLEFGVDVNEADTSRIVMSCEENMKGQVFRHVVKLKAAELPVSSAYGLHMNGPEFQLLYFKCLDEVEKMKRFPIDATTSLYDLLHIGWKRQSDFAQKLPADLKDKFPLYAGIIQASCQEALQRKPLLEPAKLGWYQITEVELPDVCVERILAHLKNRYLRVLAESLSEEGS